MRVGWIQTDPIYGAPEENLRLLEDPVVSSKADLWVIPELFATGYLFGSREEAARFAEPVPEGRTTQALLRLARRTGAALVAGLVEHSPDGRVFNSAVAVDSKGLQALYRKIHLFDREKEWFDPGDLPLPVIDLAGARVGIMICFDWRFPEAARTLALSAAQVLAHPSNLVHLHCQAAMVTRALENGVFTITANRVGTEARCGSRLTFTGGSRIVSPEGMILSDGSRDEPGSGVVEIDPRVADRKQVTPHNDLIADRRPDFYRL